MTEAPRVLTLVGRGKARHSAHEVPWRAGGVVKAGDEVLLTYRPPARAFGHGGVSRHDTGESIA